MPGKSSFGQAVEFTLFGESHSEGIGIVINGLAPGIRIDLPALKRQLSRRRAKGRISTQRHEADEPRFLSGFFNGRTTGTPLCLLIENADIRSGDYAQLQRMPRPSHADYAAGEKYLGWQDYRGGGHFSGRLTAPLVAAGAICRQILAMHGVTLGTHILSLQNIPDVPFSEEETELSAQLAALSDADFPALDPRAGESMTAAIEAAAARGDSLGGVLETVLLGIPAGLGEPFFSSVESVLSQLLFSIPGVKGVEFGAGFALSRMPGSEANDPIFLQNDRIRTRTNHNGGINGGVTNGMPVVFRCAVKPTASIYLPQETVDLETRRPARLQMEGRHDPAIIHRAAPVADAVAAMAMVDLFTQRYGCLWQSEQNEAEKPEV